MVSILDVKVRCGDLAAIRAILTADGSAVCERAFRRQTDTYFPVSTGWLKLRGRELIAYSRTDGRCDYTIVEVADEATCRRALSGVLGIYAEIDKRREIWRAGPAIVHLDEVKGLGSFVEVETPSSHVELHRRMLDQLGISGLPPEGTSYAELVRATNSMRASGVRA